MKYTIRITLLASLILCGSGCTNNTTGTNEKLATENEACVNSDACQSGLICYQKVCRKICHNSDDCSNNTQVCKNGICTTNNESECILSENCNTPGPCETTTGVQCSEGKCIYQKVSASTACSNNDACVINETCDADGNCGNGSPKICNDKSGAECTNENNTLRVFSGTGSCQSKDNIGCIYDYQDYPCNNCEENKDKCHQCENDSDCIHPWHECFKGRCDNGTCSYSWVTERTPCGYRCFNGMNYTNYGHCDSNSDEICVGVESIYCAGYQCNSSGTECATDCQKDSDCINSYYCSLQECLPKNINGHTCDLELNGRTCLGGHCGHVPTSENNICCSGTYCCEVDNDCPNGMGCNRANFTCEPESQLIGLADGESCDANSECRSNYCIDHICCRTASCGTCQFCTAGSGTCSNIDLGDQDSDNCFENGQYCNGEGVCMLPNGYTCEVANNNCISGFCIDNYCCDTNCQPISCVNNALIQNNCNSTGKEGICTATGSTTCNGYICENSTSCKTDCEDDNDCTGGYHCANTICVKNCTQSSDCGSNEYCANDATCKSKLPSKASVSCNSDMLLNTADGADKVCIDGHCIDGYCCNTACTDSCKACNISGNEGTCSAIADGSQDTCSSNQVCKSGSCVKNNGQICSKNSDCNSGNCVDGYCCNTACTDNCYSCNVSNKAGTCSPVSDGIEDGSCKDSQQCKSGTCLLKQGQKCSKNSDCYSGNCVDGYCCNSACDSSCHACNVSGKEGSCTATADGKQDTCTSGRVCASGSCKLNVGQSCQSNSDCLLNYCVDGVCCSSACDQSCYSCNGTLTKGTCSIDSSANGKQDSCGSNQVCKSGSCLKINGQICYSASDCNSGYCVDGVCCNMACNQKDTQCTKPQGAPGYQNTQYQCNYPNYVGTCVKLEVVKCSSGNCSSGCTTYVNKM